MSLAAEHLKEHDNLRRASRALTIVVNRVKGGVEVSRDVVNGVLGLFNEFAVKHFEIGEGVLFPQLAGSWRR